MAPFPNDILDILNSHLSGYDQRLGLRFVEATPDAITAELTIDERHRQPYGIVHGGVYASLVETTCSTAAAVQVFEQGKGAVGLENNTSFLHSVQSGSLRCRAVALAMGRRSHVWEAQIHDDRGRLVAKGTLRVLIVDIPGPMRPTEPMDETD
ncbi:MAG: PaaI family thioesterase [Deltaproteobacteria bacterium]|nr:PaaI family thioesterase [Deltaproteobacteria bacterium]